MSLGDETMRARAGSDNGWRTSVQDCPRRISLNAYERLYLLPLEWQLLELHKIYKV
jgi:hypothetical protein